MTDRPRGGQPGNVNRRRKDTPSGAMIYVRLTPAEKGDWQTRARVAGMNLSDWIREAVARMLKRGTNAD